MSEDALVSLEISSDNTDEDENSRIVESIQKIDGVTEVFHTLGSNRISVRGKWDESEVNKNVEEIRNIPKIKDVRILNKKRKIKRTISEAVNVSDKVTANKASNANETLFNNLLNLLQSGNVIEFNKIWELNERPSLDFSGKDFSKLNLGGINLPAFNLKECNFSESDLEEANLQEANLASAKLVKVYLRSANLEKADLSHAHARGANLMDTNLIQARCAGSLFENADFGGANVADANFHEASLVGAGLEGSNLDGANFESADLSSADLTRANARYCSFKLTKLDSTKLIEADLTGATDLPITVEEAKARGAIIEDKKTSQRITREVTESRRSESTKEQTSLPRMILVTGSRKIRNNNKETSHLAKLIGAGIINETDWILLNGGASEISSNGTIISVDHLVCMGAKDHLDKSGNDEEEKNRILTMLPQAGGQHHNIGKIEIEGKTAGERRINLVKKADAIIAIEGSVGTRDIIEIAMSLRKPLLPIPCTGGNSKKTWDNNEDVIMSDFGLMKSSREYKLLTIDGLDNAEELSKLVIKLVKHKMTQVNTIHSWHDTPIHADNPSEEDLLGRKPFAKAIAGGMRYYQENAAKSGSFLVHIYGPWGSGKSTLLEFLKDELDPPSTKTKKRWPFKDPFKRNVQPKMFKPWIIVSFNAWQHQRVRPPWWSLMDSVYAQILSNHRFPNSWGIWIKENGWRFWNSWSRSFWIAALSFAFIAAAIFLGLIPLESINKAAQSGGMGILSFFSNKIVGGVLATIVSMIAGIRAFGNSLLPSSPSAAKEFQSKTADPMQKLQRHFQQMISWTSTRPVAIFIDDLDRCSEDYTIEFLEGIQTIFRGAKNLTFVVAADRRWLYSCYQKIYSSFSETFNEIGRPLGYLFLDKTFQISVAIPKLSDRYQGVYLNYLVTLDQGFESDKKIAKERAESDVIDMSLTNLEEKLRENTNNMNLENEAKAEIIQDQAFREVMVEQIFTRPEFKVKTENFLSKFSRFMEPNPRSMKRLVTAFGLWRARDILSGNYSDEDMLAQWVIISQRWPLMANFLEEHPEIVDIIRGKEKKDWSQLLTENRVDDRTREMFLDPTISDVLMGNNVGKPLDSEVIRKFSSL